MATIQLIHASDFHFAREPLRISVWDSLRDAEARQFDDLEPELQMGWLSSYDPDCIQAFAHWLWTRQSQIDGVLLTGDIATSGHDEDLDTAHAFLHEDVLAGYLTTGHNPSLRNRSFPLGLMPGNHDRFSPFLLRPDFHPFDDQFQDFWVSPVHELLTIEKENFRFSVVGADFSMHVSDIAHHGLGYIGMGRVREHVLSQLLLETERIRDQARNDGMRCEVSWAIHFPPETTDSWLRLHGADLLIEAANTAAVRLVFHGHTHASQWLQSNETNFFICGTTSQAYSPAEGNSLLSLTFTFDNDALLAVEPKVFTYRMGNTGQFAFRFDRRLRPESLEG